MQKEKIRQIRSKVIQKHNIKNTLGTYNVCQIG